MRVRWIYRDVEEVVVVQWIERVEGSAVFGKAPSILGKGKMIGVQICRSSVPSRLGNWRG